MFKKLRENREAKAAEQARQIQIARVRADLDSLSFCIKLIEQFNNGGVREPQMKLKPSERLLVEVPRAGLVEMRSTRGSYQGGSTGVSFRIAKGVSYRVGAHRGVYEPGPEELRTIDRGLVSVTTRRVIFAGPSKTREWAFDKLLNIGEDPAKGVLMMAVSNRQKTSGILVGPKGLPQLDAAVDLGIAVSEGAGQEFADQVGDAFRQLQTEVAELAERPSQ